MLRYLLLLFCFLMLGACFTRKKTTKTAQVRIANGMTHDEAVAAITDRSELMIAEFDEPQGHLVAYQYTRYGKAALKSPKYVLYFLNDTLVRKANAEEDLRKGAKLALRERAEYLADLKEGEARQAREAKAHAEREEQAAQRHRKVIKKKKKTRHSKRKHSQNDDEDAAADDAGDLKHE